MYPGDFGGKVGQEETKMASRHNISIAEELNQHLDPQPFTKILCMLDNKSCMFVEKAHFLKRVIKNVQSHDFYPVLRSF